MHESPSPAWIALDDMLASVRPRRKRYRLALAAAAGVLLALSWWLVWATGGSRGPYLHAVYLPILLMGVTLGMGAAVATAGVATIALGPLMPLDVAAGLPQSPLSWLYRGGFFLLIGAFAGGGFHVIRARTRRIEELRADLAALYSRNLRVFAGLVEQRDEQTYGHCDRVGRNAVAIGRRLDLPSHELGRLYWAGLLHDLGKIGVPEAILRKPGRLTPEEFAEMQKHCELGKAILLDVSEAFGPIAAGLLTHHERWDGSGYPRGLAGEAIPLFGRILAVADVFEALTSHRPYRSPMTREEALRVLAEGRGSHFDPAVHDAFLAALEADEIDLESEQRATAVQEFVETVLRPDSIGMDLTDRRVPWRARR